MIALPETNGIDGTSRKALGGTRKKPGQEKYLPVGV